MSYTPPSGTTAGLTWQNATAYTPPSGAAAGLSWVEGVPQARIALPSVLQSPAVLAGQPTPAAIVSMQSVLQAPAVVAQTAAASARVSLPSVLQAPAMLAVHDFTGRIGDVTTHYVMDLVTPGGLVRVPISSWQATLQTDTSCYAQCVIPACAPWIDTINAATEFRVSRRAALPSGDALEYEMVRSPLQTAAFDRGPLRYTCSISGYSAALTAVADPPAAYDRQLVGVRSTSVTGASVRARCAIDWLLRPGHRAFIGAQPIVVDYINYYCNGSDMYCDVGSRN